MYAFITTKTKVTTMNYKKFYCLFYPLLLIALLSTPVFATDFLKGVSLSNSELNLNDQNMTTISWELTEPSKTSLFITDIGGNIVRTLLNKESKPSGIHSHNWNGKNDEGDNCLPGLYLPIIKAKSKYKGTSVYNPTKKPWGNQSVKGKLPVDETGKTASFTTNSTVYGRVRVGLGRGGPVYATASHWRLFKPGSHSVTWEDADISKKNVYVFDHFTIPENTIYLTGSQNDLQKTEKNYTVFPIHPPHGGQISFFALDPGSLSAEPEISVIWDTTPAKNKLGCNVSFTDPQHPGSVLAGPSELLIFVDDIFISETSIIVLPATIEIDTSKITNGTHNIVINLMTSDLRAGIYSRQITINN